MGKVKIQESEFDLADGGKGKIAMLIYVGEDDPVGPLDQAVRNYVGHHGYMEFIDINMDNPWVRVVVSNVNEMMPVDFDPKKHKLSNI